MLISCAVIAQLIWAFVSAYTKPGFLMIRLRCEMHRNSQLFIFIYDVNKQETVFWYYCVVTTKILRLVIYNHKKKHTQKNVIMARESLSLDSHPNFGVGWVGLYFFFILGYQS